MKYKEVYAAFENNCNSHYSKDELAYSTFCSYELNMHAYLYARRRKHKKDRRLATEQQRQQYNAWFSIRICAFRGLDEVAFRRMSR